MLATEGQVLCIPTNVKKKHAGLGSDTNYVGSATLSHKKMLLGDGQLALSYTGNVPQKKEILVPEEDLEADPVPRTQLQVKKVLNFVVTSFNEN